MARQSPAIRRTKIVATLGPAWEQPEQMCALLDAGVNLVRVNSSHGTPEIRAKWITDFHAVQRGRPAASALLVDLQGPRIRVGGLPEPRTLEAGEQVVFALEDSAREGDIPTTYAELAGDVVPGNRILLDDGLLAVDVVAVQGDRVTGKVRYGGVLKANKGNFLWFGRPGSPDQRKKIGSLLETPNFYHYLSAINNLRVTQSISGRGTAADIDTVLKKVRLFERRKSRFSTFSLGMKQRLAIASSLLGDPQVLVLDEPTNGLDPVGIAEIRQLILELRKSGHTIILASHLLDEVEKVCTHVAILKTGTLLTTGDVEEVLMDEDVVELSAPDLASLANVLRQINDDVVMDGTSNTIHLRFPRGEARLDEINSFCFKNGIALNHLILKKKRLEARFFELTNN